MFGIGKDALQRAEFSFPAKIDKKIHIDMIFYEVKLYKKGYISLFEKNY